MYFIEFFNLPNLYKNFFTPWKAERERLKTLWKLRKSSKTKTAKCSSQKHVSKPNVQVSLALETVKGPKSPTKTSVKVSNVKCFPQSICSSETHLASQKWSFSRITSRQICIVTHVQIWSQIKFVPPKLSCKQNCTLRQTDANRWKYTTSKTPNELIVKVNQQWTSTMSKSPTRLSLERDKRRC